MMWIDSDGIRLNTALERPHAGRCPLVILFHGFTGHMEEAHIRAAAGTFRALGCATLRADLYGHGRSGGTFREHTLFKWQSNALTLVDYARTLDFVTDVYLCGHSQGGLLAMLAGGMLSDRVRGLILLSPAANIPEAAREGCFLGQRFDPRRVPDVVGVWDGMPLGGDYARVAQTIHVETAIDRFSGPVLLVHGTADETVPVQVGIDTAKRYKNAHLALIEGDDHCYNRHLDQVLEEIWRWMEGRICR